MGLGGKNWKIMGQNTLTIPGFSNHLNKHMFVEESVPHVQPLESVVTSCLKTYDYEL